MPSLPFNIAAGINTEATGKDAEPKWKDCNRIRFRGGYPESIGGWIPDNSDTISGVCRGINNWVTTTSQILIGLGTNTKLYIWQGGAYSDVTPLFDSTSAPFSSTKLSNVFSSTAGSDLISVAHTAHGRLLGDSGTFSNATASPTDGTLIDGTYTVISVTDLNTYVIQISSAVTTTEASFGGTIIDYDYEINIGKVDTASAFGLGAGAWGDGTWGTIRTSSLGVTKARTWSLDQWGEDLIANVKGGNIYHWDATNGLTTRAVIITGAPTTVNFILVTPVNRQLVAFGVGTDPLLIQYSSMNDFTDFNILSTTNTAGELRIDKGSEIISAIRTRGQIMIFTDVSAHSMFPTNGSLLWGIKELGNGCGIASPHAAAEHAGIVRYMGIDNFYIYDGLIRILPCDVWTKVFKDINLFQKEKFHTSTVIEQDETWFFYCSSTSDEIDRYAKIHNTSGIWDYGTIERTAWVDIGQGGGLTVPYAIDASGVLYQQETGVNDGVTTALNSFIESYDIDIATKEEVGGSMFHIKKLHPDFKRLSGDIDISLSAKPYPQSAATTKVYTAVSSTERISTRVRGRQVSIKMAQNQLNGEWASGIIIAEILVDGRR